MEMRIQQLKFRKYEVGEGQQWLNEDDKQKAFADSAFFERANVTSLRKTTNKIMGACCASESLDNRMPQDAFEKIMK